MKSQCIAAALVLVSLGIGGCAKSQPARARSSAPIVLDFEKDEPGKLPHEFEAALTGGGGAGAWVIQDDASAPSGKHVLTQTSVDETSGRFPLCIFKNTTAKDVSVSVKFKAVSGKVDQAAGLVVRLADKDNYYITRANALEDNVRLYKIVAGKRIQFAGVNQKVTPGEWHTLALRVSGSHFVVSLDGKELFQADDDTFKDAGRVGLWTKADSVTEFDDLEIKPEPGN